MSGPTKISGLPTASALDGTEQVPVVQAAATKKSLLSTIADWIIKTYTGFLQSGIGAVATDIQTQLRKLLALSNFDTEAHFNSAQDALTDPVDHLVYDPVPAATPYLKTVSDIVNGVPVSLLRFISRAQHAAIHAGTSTFDAAANVQVGIDAMYNNGRGILTVPYGRIALGSALEAKQNFVMRGMGMDMSQLYLLNDTGMFLASTDTTYKGSIGLEDMTLYGYADRNTVLGDDTNRLASIPYVNYLWFKRVRAMYCRQMSLTGVAAQFAKAIECEVLYSLRDGINLTGSQWMHAINNKIRWCGDDAIALHVRNGATGLYNSPVVVHGNVINFSYGIKVLGARNASIKGNVGRFLESYMIYLGWGAPSGEGYREMLDVEIDGNRAMDIFTGSAKGCITVVGNLQKGTGNDAYPEGYSFTGAAMLKPEDTWQNVRSSASTDPAGPNKGLSITNNSLMQTLAPATLFSDYGIGQRWSNSGFAADAAYSGTIYQRNSAQNSNAVQLWHTADSFKLYDNFFYGFLNAVDLETDESSRCKNMEVKRNHFERIAGAGVVFSGTITRMSSGHLEVSDNLFDMDPLYEHADHGTDGVWASPSGTGCVPFYPVNEKAALFHHNTIKNAKKPIHSSATGTRIMSWNNKVFRNPVTGGGVGSSGLGLQEIIVPVATDVTTELLNVSAASGPFTIGETVTGGTSGATATVVMDDNNTILVTGRVGTFTAAETLTGGTSAATATYSASYPGLGEMLYIGAGNNNYNMMANTVMPTRGYYAKGAFVRNITPSLDASNMVLVGWRRLTNGNAHVSGTDWVNVYESHVSPAT